MYRRGRWEMLSHHVGCHTPPIVSISIAIMTICKLNTEIWKIGFYIPYVYVSNLLKMCQL